MLIHWPSGYKTRDQTSHSTLHSCLGETLFSRPCLWHLNSECMVMPPSHLHRAVGCCGAGRGGITSDILAKRAAGAGRCFRWVSARRALTRDTVKYPPWKIHQEGWKYWDWGLKPRFQTPFLRHGQLWRGQTSGFHHSPLPQLKKKTTDRLCNRKIKIVLFFNDFYTLHGSEDGYTTRM